MRNCTGVVYVSWKALFVGLLLSALVVMGVAWIAERVVERHKK